MDIGMYSLLSKPVKVDAIAKLLWFRIIIEFIISNLTIVKYDFNFIAQLWNSGQIWLLNELLKSKFCI